MLDRTFHIRIDDELYDALKIEAERQDRSMAAQNRAILRRALIEEKLEQGGGSDALFVRDDNRETLVVLPWATWTQIMGWLRWAEIYPAETTNED